MKGNNRYWFHLQYYSTMHLSSCSG